MSWKDRIENSKFSITTGDGKKYTPFWIKGEKGKEYNVPIYDFIDVEGSYLPRKKPKSSNYPLVFYFQGPDNIDQAEDFEQSANDPRAWEVNHPFYGVINGQPTKINRNDNSLNVTTITVDFWESVSDVYPSGERSPKDRVFAQKTNVLKAAEVSFASGIKPEASDIFTIKDANNAAYASFSPLLDSTNKVDYQSAYNNSLKAAEEVVTDPKKTITSAQDLFNQGSDINTSIKGKVGAFKSTYYRLKTTLQDLNEKYFFESNAAACISNVTYTAINPNKEDYTVREEVQEVMETIILLYNDYLKTLDNAQISVYDVDNYWIPDSQLQIKLYELVYSAIGDLYKIAFNAKQERVVYLEQDSNLFVVAHRYFGLDQDDIKLEQFRTINNIKNEELFILRKGRKIKYYV